MGKLWPESPGVLGTHPCVCWRAWCPSLCADAEFLPELGHGAGGLCSSLRREVHLGPQQGEGQTRGKPLRYGPNPGPRIRGGRLEWGGEILQPDDFHVCPRADVWPLHPGTESVGRRDGVVGKGAGPPESLQRREEPGGNQNDTGGRGHGASHDQPFWRRPLLNKLCSPFFWLLGRAGCQFVSGRDMKSLFLHGLGGSKEEQRWWW